MLKAALVVVCIILCGCGTRPPHSKPILVEPLSEQLTKAVEALPVPAEPEQLTILFVSTEEITNIVIDVIRRVSKDFAVMPENLYMRYDQVAIAVYVPGKHLLMVSNDFESYDASTTETFFFEGALIKIASKKQSL